jgi:FkbM family methyltransferase
MEGKIMKTLRSVKKAMILVGEATSLKGKLSIIYYFLKSPWYYFHKKSGRKPSSNLPFEVTLKNEDGIFFCGKDMTSVWIGSSFHEKTIKKYFSLRDGVFIDIGANIGRYVIIVSKHLKSGSVIAIEPEKNNFEILKKNIGLNKLSNVILKNLACSDKVGKIYFYIDGFSSGGHSIKPKKGFRKIYVKTSRVDRILAELKIKRVDLIKIDVEGAEAEVLKGAIKTLKKYHPKIIFEAWEDKKLKIVKDILDPLGYRIEKIGKIDYLAYKNG